MKKGPENLGAFLFGLYDQSRVNPDGMDGITVLEFQFNLAIDPQVVDPITFGNDIKDLGIANGGLIFLWQTVQQIGGNFLETNLHESILKCIEQKYMQHRLNS